MTGSDVISWLAGRAVPLDSVDPTDGYRDLTSMRHFWSDVRVVGLGEATHGTKEFFTLKHRLITFSVVELGVRVVALEASESAATAVDDYVTYGRGNPARALAGLAFWTWRTRELLALLEWLRAHNAELALDDRVRFVGIDPQIPAVAAEVVTSYLAKVVPAELPRFTDALEALARNRVTEPPLPESTLRSAEEISEVVKRWSVNSSEENARVRRHAAYLVRSAQLATAPHALEAGEFSMYAVRDRLMAEAVADLVGTQDHTGPQVVVWAHNGHLQTGDDSEAHPSMGAHLRKQFGRKYYALGLMFGSGSFRAHRARLWGGRTPAPVKHRRGTAPPATVEGHLAKAHPGDHFIDLHDQDAPQAVTEWLATRSWVRQHGAVESPFYRLGFTPIVPGADYDGLAYVHRSSPSTPLGLT